MARYRKRPWNEIPNREKAVILLIFLVPIMIIAAGIIAGKFDWLVP